LLQALVVVLKIEMRGRGVTEGLKRRGDRAGGPHRDDERGLTFPRRKRGGVGEGGGGPLIMDDRSQSDHGGKKVWGCGEKEEKCRRESGRKKKRKKRFQRAIL